MLPGPASGFGGWSVVTLLHWRVQPPAARARGRRRAAARAARAGRGRVAARPGRGRGGRARAAHARRRRRARGRAGTAARGGRRGRAGRRRRPDAAAARPAAPRATRDAAGAHDTAEERPGDKQLLVHRENPPNPFAARNLRGFLVRRRPPSWRGQSDPGTGAKQRPVRREGARLEAAGAHPRRRPSPSPHLAVTAR